MKVVLVHGYGIGINGTPPFKMFTNELGNEIAKVFRWEEVEPNGSRIKMLKLETQKAMDPTTHMKFRDYLEEHQPDIVLGHSLGSFLIFKYLKNFKFPSSVKKLIFVQGILDRKFVISNENIEICNYYCPWDYVLWTGMFFHKVLPCGLFAASDPKVKNKMFPLYKPSNLHTSSIRDKNFLKELTT